MNCDLMRPCTATRLRARYRHSDDAPTSIPADSLKLVLVSRSPFRDRLSGPLPSESGRLDVLGGDGPAGVGLPTIVEREARLAR